MPEWKGLKYTLQVAAEDCTGCGMCVDVCPARNKSEARLKAINMRPQAPLREAERDELEFLPDPAGDATGARSDSTACASSRCCSRCSNSPARAPAAARRLTSSCSRNLFGDRAGHRQRHRLFLDLRRQSADHALREERRRPRAGLGNSLFEDNAEFGLGFRVSMDKQKEFAGELLQQLCAASRARACARKF